MWFQGIFSEDKKAQHGDSKTEKTTTLSLAGILTLCPLILSNDIKFINLILNVSKVIIALKINAISRSGRSQMFFLIGVLKNYSIFTGKHLCWSLFLIKCGLSGLHFIVKRLPDRCFPVDTVKFLRTAFSIGSCFSTRNFIFDEKTS